MLKGGLGLQTKTGKVRETELKIVRVKSFSQAQEPPHTHIHGLLGDNEKNSEP